MKRRVPGAAVFVLFLVSALAAADVVVLRGGVVVQLSRPPVRQGRNVLLTRVDGTLLSVPATEIDAAATAKARSAAPPPAPAVAAPPATLAEAARATREVPKARVRITDADVTHHEAAARPSAEAGEETQKEAIAAAGAGRVEVADYAQEKSGEALVVRGALRNPGGTPASNVRLSVTALDAKGQTIASGEAGLSSTSIDPSGSVNFSVTIPVGSRVVGSLRFAPRWVAPEPAPAPAAPGSTDPANRAGSVPAAPADPAAAAPKSPPPPPAPTPVGRGTLYAPPAPSAPSSPPADGKTGYLPGASHPGNQPKPPS
jgi:hypothetical protein